MSVLVGEWGVGPQVNKFEQVSSDDHQMSVVRVGRGWVCPAEGGWGRGGGEGEGRTPPCGLSHDACDVTYVPPVDRMMERCL